MGTKITAKQAGARYGTSGSTLRGWMVRARIQDAGRNYKNELLYDVDALKELEQYLETSPTGRMRIIRGLDVSHKPEVKLTRKRKKKKAACDYCGKEAKTTRKNTCGSEKCYREAMLMGGFISG